MNSDADPPRYKPQSLDTDEATERQLFQLWAALSPRERAERVSAATLELREVKLAALARAHPELPRDAIELLEAEQRLGPDLARAAFAKARDLGLRP